MLKKITDAMFLKIVVFSSNVNRQTYQDGAVLMRNYLNKLSPERLVEKIGSIK